MRSHPKKGHILKPDAAPRGDSSYARSKSYVFTDSGDEARVGVRAGEGEEGVCLLEQPGQCSHAIIIP